jgi:hypothetical protein
MTVGWTVSVTPLCATRCTPAVPLGITRLPTNAAATIVERRRLMFGEVR